MVVTFLTPSIAGQAGTHWRKTMNGFKLNLCSPSPLSYHTENKDLCFLSINLSYGKNHSHFTAGEMRCRKTGWPCSHGEKIRCFRIPVVPSHASWLDHSAQEQHAFVLKNIQLLLGIFKSLGISLGKSSLLSRQYSLFLQTALGIFTWKEG